MTTPASVESYSPMTAMQAEAWELLSMGYTCHLTATAELNNLLIAYDNRTIFIVQDVLDDDTLINTMELDGNAIELLKKAFAILEKN